MSEAIVYCDKCARLIPPTTSGTNGAVIGANGALCRACAATVPAAAVKAITQKTPTPSPSGSRRTRSQKHALRTGSNANSLKFVLASFGLAMIAAMTATMVFISSGGDAENESTQNETRPASAAMAALARPAFRPEPVAAPNGPERAAPSPVTQAKPEESIAVWSPNEEPHPPSPLPTPSADERLSMIRARITPALTGYGAIRASLRSFADEFIDQPEGMEAELLLKDIDEKFAAAASAALQSAVSAAKKLSTSGEYGTALSVLRSVAPRFNEGNWYAKEGKAAVDLAMADVEKQRRESSAGPAGGVGGAEIVLFEDAVRPDWEMTSWGGAVFSVHTASTHSGSPGALLLNAHGASPWSGCHLTTRGPSVAGANAFALSEAARNQGSLVFFVNGSADANGQHVGGQKVQIGISRRTSGGGTWEGGGSIPLDEFLEGGGIDSDPATWQRARIPLKRLMAKGIVTVLGDLGFQFLGDAPAAGIVIDSVTVYSGSAPAQPPATSGTTPPSAEPVAPQPATGTAPRKVASNIVKNGGFESLSDGQRMATGWRPHVWGREDSQASIRIDGANAHDGERSLTVRASADGSEPGAHTSLGSSLLPGTYELTFWACADAGEEARATIQLGEIDPFTAQIGDEWQELRTRVVVEKRLFQPVVRVRSRTRNVRVWFDDVAVRRVADQ